MTRVNINAEMPDDALEAFLQILRSWDNKRTDRHMNIVLLETGFSGEQVRALFERLTPSFDDITFVSLARTKES